MIVSSCRTTIFDVFRNFNARNVNNNKYVWFSQNDDEILMFYRKFSIECWNRALRDQLVHGRAAITVFCEHTASRDHRNRFSAVCDSVFADDEFGQSISSLPHRQINCPPRKACLPYWRERKRSTIGDRWNSPMVYVLFFSSPTS